MNGTSLVIQWLRLYVSTAGSVCSISGQILQLHSQNKKKISIPYP